MLHVVRLFWSRLKRFNKCCWNVKWNKWMNEWTNEWNPPWISGRMHERRPERVNLFSVRMRVRWGRSKVGNFSILSHLVHHPYSQMSENNVSIVLVYEKKTMTFFSGIPPPTSWVCISNSALKKSHVALTTVANNIGPPATHLVDRN